MADDPLMSIAWRDFVMWASGNADIIAQFNAVTGRTFMNSRPSSPLDALIDEATGKTADDAKAFALWVTEHFWGVDDAPDGIRAEIQQHRGG